MRACSLGSLQLVLCWIHGGDSYGFVYPLFELFEWVWTTCCRVSKFYSLSMSNVRYLIAIRWICCMHAYMGIKGMQHCLKSLVMLFVCIPPQMPIVRITSVTYHPTSTSASTRGW